MSSEKETVMVTGASAGLGRAIACEFAKHGARIGLLARGKAGLEGAAEQIRSSGGSPLILEADVSDADAVEKAAATLEDALWPNRRLGKQRHGFRILAGEGNDGGGIQTGHGSDLSRRCKWHALGDQAHAAAQSGKDCAGRLGACLPQHSLAVRLLRRQACHRRLHRLATLRVNP